MQDKPAIHAEVLNRVRRGASMFAEYLRFRVELGHVAEFQAHNRRWRDALARQEGFLGQEVLRHAQEADTWLVVVRWRDRAAMLAFPDAVQRALNTVGEQLSTLVRADHFEEVAASPPDRDNPLGLHRGDDYAPAGCSLPEDSGLR